MKERLNIFRWVHPLQEYPPNFLIFQPDLKEACRSNRSLYFRQIRNEEESSIREYIFRASDWWGSVMTEQDVSRIFGIRKNCIGYRAGCYSPDYYSYCGDMSAFLNSIWVPVLTWFLINIFPNLILSVIALLFTLRSKCVRACCTEPWMILCSVFSHFHVGPVSLSKTKSGYITRSIYLTHINILFTFLAMCFSIYLVIPALGKV